MVWWRSAGEPHFWPLVLMWEQRRSWGMEISSGAGFEGKGQREKGRTERLKNGSRSERAEDTARREEVKDEREQAQDGILGGRRAAACTAATSRDEKERRQPKNRRSGEPKERIRGRTALPRKALPSRQLWARRVGHY